MNWLYKLEAKYGRYAIRNLPFYIVIASAIGFVLDLVSQGMIYYDLLSLNPYMIIHRFQIWRLFTFVFAAPSTNIFFIIFVLLFYYSIGQALNNVWGAFKFNMYMLVGVLTTILGAFLIYFLFPNTMIFMDTTYLNMSMFLAYASIFPEAMVYIYGILPIRVKWLAYLDVAMLAYSFFTGSVGMKIAIVTSLLNFLLFFFSTRNYRRISPKEVKRKRNYKKQVQNVHTATRHQCAICKRTELDDPNLEFRFCSKCNGDFEYCNDHLFTHTHVK